MRKPHRTFVAAVGLVSIGMVAAIVVGDVSNGPAGILMAPILPAMVVLWSMFTGGPHGVSIGWYPQAVAVFVIGVAMWWAVFEACRRLWNRLRPEPKATRPRCRSDSNPPLE